VFIASVIDTIVLDFHRFHDTGDYVVAGNNDTGNSLSLQQNQLAYTSE
jgi:hypothetical protein